MSEERAPALPAPLAERFRPERILGTGSFGTVFLARAGDGSAVALKVLAPEVARHPQLRARFERELRAGRELSSRHVVTLRDGGVVGEVAFLVLEFVDGQDLDALRSRRGGRLELAEADRVLDQLLQGVADLHAAGLVHRDLKPANVLVEEGGRVVLADLGLVRGALDATLTRTGQLLGTPLYMPPEQMRGEAVGPEADLYALGAIYFELLTGHPPFDGHALGDILEAKQAGLVGGLRAERVDVPVGLDRLLAAWLGPDPAARPADAAALRRAWERARRGGSETGVVVGGDGTRVAPSPASLGEDATRCGPGEAAPGGHAPTRLGPRVSVAGGGDATHLGPRVSAAGGDDATRLEPSPPLRGREDPTRLASPSRSGGSRVRRGAALVLAALGAAGLWLGTRGEPPAPPLSPEGRRHLEVLREGVVAPAIDDAVHLTGTDRTPEVVETWQRGLEAFVELLRSEAARQLARELEAARLDAGEGEDLGEVLLRWRLLATSLESSGGLRTRPNEVASRLERAYDRLLSVARVPSLDLETVGERDDVTSDASWSWARFGDGRRAEERRAVEALGGTWELVRRWDRDFQRYDIEGPRNLRPRLAKLSLTGEPFQDASEDLPALLKMARSSTHEALRRQDPRRLEVAVRDPRGRPLVLAGTATRWNPTIHGVLTLVGADDQLRLPFDVPPPGQGAAPEPGHELHVGFLLRVAAGVLPEGLREVRIRAFGLQPIGTIDQVVQVCELYQQVSGPVPQLARQPTR